MAATSNDDRKQAEDLLLWAADCEAVAKRLRGAAAELLNKADKSDGSSAVAQQQQQIQPQEPKKEGK